MQVTSYSQAVTVAMHKLCVLYGRRPIDADQIEVWRDSFLGERASLEEMARACQYVADHSERWPSWAQMRQAILHAKKQAYAESQAAASAAAQVDAGPPSPRFGVVLLPDGSPDPDWPELPDREPAWRRKALFDAGLVSWACAHDPQPRDKRGKGPVLPSPDERRRGARRIL